MHVSINIQTYMHYAYIYICIYTYVRLLALHAWKNRQQQQRSQSEAIFILNKLRKKGGKSARIVGRFIKLNECELWKLREARMG